MSRFYSVSQGRK